MFVKTHLQYSFPQVVFDPGDRLIVDADVRELRQQESVIDKVERCFIVEVGGVVQTARIDELRHFKEMCTGGPARYKAVLMTVKESVCRKEGYQSRSYDLLENQAQLQSIGR